MLETLSTNIGRVVKFDGVIAERAATGKVSVIPTASGIEDDDDDKVIRGIKINPSAAKAALNADVDGTAEGVPLQTRLFFSNLSFKN